MTKKLKELMDTSDLRAQFSAINESAKDASLAAHRLRHRLEMGEVELSLASEINNCIGKQNKADANRANNVAMMFQLDRLELKYQEHALALEVKIE